MAERSVFERLEWTDDGFVLGDVVFHLVPKGADISDTSVNEFRLYKTRPMLRAYAGFWASQIDFQARNILELGIWDGGSSVFWFEQFRPDKLVAIDISERGDSAYFRHYVESQGLQDRLSTMWGVDQSDVVSLSDTVIREFSGPLDLVIDDASHQYYPTKRSFETLFPLMRPGGQYIIEDWSWEYNPEYREPDHPWATRPGLSRLVLPLIQLAGTRQRVLANVTVFRNFIAIERGKADPDEALDFEVPEIRSLAGGGARRRSFVRAIGRTLLDALTSALRRTSRRRAA